MLFKLISQLSAILFFLIVFIARILSVLDPRSHLISAPIYALPIKVNLYWYSARTLNASQKYKEAPLIGTIKPCMLNMSCFFPGLNFPLRSILAVTVSVLSAYQVIQGNCINMGIIIVHSSCFSISIGSSPPVGWIPTYSAEDSRSHWYRIYTHDSGLRNDSRWR